VGQSRYGCDSGMAGIRLSFLKQRGKDFYVAVALPRCGALFFTKVFWFFFKKEPLPFSCFGR
jgi:hypothetical protein